MQKKLESQFAEVIAPGQSEELIENVQHANTDEGKTETIPDDLQVQIKMYKDNGSLGKHVILSLTNHSKYSKEQVMNCFQCSKRQVDQARKLEAQSRFTVPHEHKITRLRVPQEKTEHFLEFLLLSALLQDVAYGINNIKFENGERRKVSNAILTMRYNHTISYYKKFCLDIGYAPISDSSSWRILKEINPSQRKALAGLDDITGAGMNGFTSLSKVSEIMSDKMLTKNIGKGKRYLKSSFPGKLFKCFKI